MTDTTTTPQGEQTIHEIVLAIRDGGLSPQYLAALAHAGRTDVYSWFGGAPVAPESEDRIREIHGLLAPGIPDYRTLGMVWARRLAGGGTIGEVLSRDTVDVDAIKAALADLAPTLHMYSLKLKAKDKREARKAGGNPVVDALPRADLGLGFD